MIIGRHLLLLTVWAVFDIRRSTCLYDFGTAIGDTLIFTGADTAHRIDLNTPFRFYGTNESVLWMSSNGVVSFDGPFTSYSPRDLITDYASVIAVYHDDLISIRFIAYHRESTAPSDLQLSTAFVRTLFPSESTFTATRAIVLTWDPITSSAQVLTLQTALITSNTISVVINLYKEITGTVYLAMIGVHAGDGTNFQELCLARTPDIILVDERAQQPDSTNGLYGFIVEKGQSTTCVPSVSGIDVTPVQLGDGTCVFDFDCIDMNAACNQSGICICKAEFVDSDTEAVLGGSCLSKVPNLAACIPGLCIDENAVCNTASTCVCKSGFGLTDSNICKVPNLAACIPGLCIDENAVCNTESICACKSGFGLNDSNICQLKVPNLDACIPGLCIDENAVCNTASICVCKSGFGLNDSNICQLSESSIRCIQDRDNLNIVNVTVTILRNISFGLQSLKTESFDNGVREQPENPGCKSPVSLPYSTLMFDIDLSNTSFPGCGVKLNNDSINVTIEAIQEDNVYQANDTIYQLSCNILPGQTNADHGVGQISYSGPLDRSDRYIRMDIMYVGRNVVATEAILGQYLTIRITYDPGVESSLADPLGVTPISCEAGDSPNYFLSRKMLVDGCLPSVSYSALKLNNHFVRTSSPSDRVWMSGSGSFKSGHFITTNRLYIRCTVRFCIGLKLDECIKSCNSTGSRRKRDDILVREETIESSIVIYNRADIQEITKGNCVDETIAYMVLGTLGVLISLTVTVTVFMFAYLMK